MKYICTYFDINFLPRGIALLDSLEKNVDNFTLYIFALDDDVAEYFNKLGKKNIQIITLQEYSVYFSVDKKKYKNEKEFYFSLTPAICLYIMKKFENIDLLLYLDADVYLFNNLEILYSEIGDASIAICPHRLPWYINFVSKNYGIYNVGVNAFRNDAEGVQCLEKWHKDCSTWTQNQEGYPLSFFSDQIWLDKWPTMYKNIKIINHIGINVAPWNAIQYDFSTEGDRYFVNKIPLVIYHFSSLKKIDTDTWHGNTSFTILNISGCLNELYEEYIKNIEKYYMAKNDNIIDLKVSGSKLKMFLYNLLKNIHKHKIKIYKEIQ